MIGGFRAFRLAAARTVSVNFCRKNTSRGLKKKVAVKRSLWRRRSKNSITPSGVVSSDEDYFWSVNFPYLVFGVHVDT